MSADTRQAEAISFLTERASGYRKAVYPLIAVAGVIGLAAIYLIDPREPGNYPICPFFGLTGWHCPGCGTLRALHQLLHGDIAAAFGFNAYTMLAVPAIVYSLSTDALRAYGLPAPPRLFIPAGWIWALLAAVAVFWILRNLPVEPLTILAP